MHLEITNLNKSFSTKRGSVVALKDINMHVETSEFVCAVGASGSGKSTLLRMIAGLETPTSGKIFMVKEKELLEEWRGLASFSCSASFPKLIPV